MNLFKLIYNKIKFSIKPSLRVSEYYEEWTDKYMSGFGEIFQSKQAISDEVLIDYFIEQMGVKDGMFLLDAGCGVCGPAIKIAKLKDVIIDAYTISPTQVKIGLEKIKNAGLTSKVHPFLGDFHHLKNAPDNKYDLVYFLESLVHSHDPQSAIWEAKRVLKPDGIIYIKDLFEKTAYNLNEIEDIKKWVKHNNRNLALNIIKKEELLNILREAGFQLEFCQLMKIDTNQNKGNKFVTDFKIMPDPIKNSLPAYLEWYEIKAIKPGPKIVFKL
jgi:ubiquinone/menaquinone biosynthesis C-methylase UbiE